MMYRNQSSLKELFFGTFVASAASYPTCFVLAQAVKDLSVKVKHKIHSEIITVYSD